MLDSVVHRFLGDVVKVVRNAFVMNQDGIIALEAAGDTEDTFDFAGVLLQSRHQTMSV